MILEVSPEGLDYLADLSFWDLDYKEGLHATPEPTGTQAEDLMVLKLYDRFSTTMNPDGSPTGESWEPRSDTYFTDQILPNSEFMAVMKRTIRRLMEEGYLVDAEDGINI